MDLLQQSRTQSTEDRVGAMGVVVRRTDRKESHGGTHARTESPSGYRGSGGGGGKIHSKIWRQAGSNWQKW